MVGRLSKKTVLVLAKTQEELADGGWWCLTLFVFVNEHQVPPLNSIRLTLASTPKFNRTRGSSSRFTDTLHWGQEIWKQDQICTKRKEKKKVFLTSQQKKHDYNIIRIYFTELIGYWGFSCMYFAIFKVNSYGFCLNSGINFCLKYVPRTAFQTSLVSSMGDCRAVGCFFFLFPVDRSNSVAVAREFTLKKETSKHRIIPLRYILMGDSQNKDPVHFGCEEYQ